MTRTKAPSNAQVSLSDGEWYCNRPNRRLSVLEYSLVLPGLNRPCLPGFVDNDVEVRRDDFGRLWYKGLPPIGQIADKYFSSPHFLKEAAQKRSNDLENLRQAHVQLLIYLGQLSRSNVLSVVDLLESSYELLFRNINIGLIDDEMVRRGEDELSRRHGRRITQVVLSAVMRSTYSKNALQAAVSLPTNEDLDFTHDDLMQPIVGNVSLSGSQLLKDYAGSLTGELAQQLHRVSDESGTILDVVSLAYQLGQENYFAGGPFRYTAGAAFCRILAFFENHKKPLSIVDLQNRTIVEVRKHAESI